MISRFSDKQSGMNTRFDSSFGGLITAIAGMIAHKFGPGVGGLLLAFPAILPASATLIEKHEKQRKQSAGFDGTKRGRKAAGVDAAGAAMGSIGLFVFALLVWHFISRKDTWAVLEGRHAGLADGFRAGLEDSKGEGYERQSANFTDSPLVNTARIGSEPPWWAHSCVRSRHAPARE